MNKKAARNALGRGLSNLIPVKLEESTGKNEVHNVSIGSIKTNPFQPRLDFNEEEIAGLADSIKRQGLLQPIVVRQKENVFEIISGERRFRAFQVLKRDAVPCIIKQNISDREMLELALIENIQREELNEIEKAVAYQKLLLEYNYTHDQLSEQIGKSRATITNSIRLLNLPEEIQKKVRSNEISMGHARALLGLSNEEMFQIVKKISEEHLSVREVENIVKPSKKKIESKAKDANIAIEPDNRAFIEQLEYKYGTSVQIQKGQKKGLLTFQFFGIEDLTRLVDLLIK
jgi:ParB family transcriptional regulator, chromosome partitioning protein